jgi:hypothetical protein
MSLVGNQTIEDTHQEHEEEANALHPDSAVHLVINQEGSQVVANELYSLCGMVNARLIRGVGELTRLIRL